ncbi:MAG: transcription termination/antitermination protein NusG [Lachnospiraceae bacterium]|nr:transcription termination/antitermination protein NusG [Lachnospiraceae bacterium]
MADEELSPKWYVAHTYSGYENKVKVDLEKTIENRNLQDQIMEVCVPVYEDEEETESGRKKAVSRKLFPGYVLIHMFMNDDTWYVVRNTRGVTGFVGPGSKPVPLTEEEVRKLGMHAAPVECDFNEGDSVVVTGGVWAGTIGQVKTINLSKQRLTIVVDMFGRETPVELGFDEVKPSE